jgi:hypothetical protein
MARFVGVQRSEWSLVERGAVPIGALIGAILGSGAAVAVTFAGALIGCGLYELLH